MNEFELSLTGDGISVKRTVDRQTALSILNSVLGGGIPSVAATQAAASASENSFPQPMATSAGLPSTVGEATPATSAQSTSKPTSLREFVNDYEPKTNAQVILCIAQFFAQHEGIERFGRDDIRPKFPAAGEPLPKNFSRDFQTAIDKGWIGEDPGSRDKFYITRTGETQISKGFKGRRN